MDTKFRWKAAYDAQAFPSDGGWRDFNGYRHPRIYKLLIESLRRATSHWQDMDILDAGCGSGDTGGFLAEQNRVVGTDFSLQMGRAACRVYSEVALGDVERLPFAAASFDGLVASGVWQCLPMDSPFLSEAARVLKPGGELVLAWVLNRDYLLYKNNEPHFRLDPEVKLTLYTASNIPSQLAVAGLRLKRFYAALFPFAVVRGAPRWLRAFVPAYTLLAVKDA
jgi:ubiquinone/menaquinone biosynthesis C-methylase UbiE